MFESVVRGVRLVRRAVRGVLALSTAAVSRGRHFGG